MFLIFFMQQCNSFESDNEFRLIKRNINYKRVIYIIGLLLQGLILLYFGFFSGLMPDDIFG